MPPNKKDFNLTISIYMSKEVAERLIIILLTFVIGLPISFLTAWYVSKQAFYSLDFDTYYESTNPKYNIK